MNCYLQSPYKKLLIADNQKIIDHNKNITNEPLLIMKQRIIGFFYGFDNKHLPFTMQAIAKAVANLTENGIIQYHLERMYGTKYLRLQPKPKEPEVLTLSQLAIGFKLIGAFIGLAIATFVVEVDNRI